MVKAEEAMEVAKAEEVMEAAMDSVSCTARQCHSISHSEHWNWSRPTCQMNWSNQRAARCRSKSLC